MEGAIALERNRNKPIIIKMGGVVMMMLMPVMLMPVMLMPVMLVIARAHARDAGDRRAHEHDDRDRAAFARFPPAPNQRRLRGYYTPTS